MNRPHTTSAEFFDAKYRKNPDPWSFARSAYELRRYEAILQSLRGPYLHAWEPGCSIGVLTEKLAVICERVNACELSPTAAERARTRCAHLPNVHIRCASLANEVPADCDLIVLSEVGYYFSASDWRAQVSKIVSAIEPGATLLAVHWLGYSVDHLQSGDDVHAILIAHPSLQHEHGERHPHESAGFRLDRWRRI